MISFSTKFFLSKAGATVGENKHKSVDIPTAMDAAQLAQLESAISVLGILIPHLTGEARAEAEEHYADGIKNFKNYKERMEKFYNIKFPDPTNKQKKTPLKNEK